jgi:hypothetical protein
MPKQLTRERWLNKVATALTPTFKRLGHTVPPLRISTGFTSKGRIGSAVAECWTDRADADRKYQIFIDPRDDSPVEVINSVAHEIIHAAVGLKCGHRGDFAKVAKALGMLPPMPSTPSGPDFVALAEAIIAKVGPYPHAALQVSRKRPSTPADGAVVDLPAKPEPVSTIISSGPKPQRARLLKAECPSCRYTVRVTKKWLAVAAPTCPSPDCARLGQPMKVD